jgi:diguanylate cyclase (GGDEF)-like protein
MVDLDDFKLYNDTLGHEAGDALLRALGRFLSSHVRAEDIACRYGGEEFTILLPSAAEDQLLRRAEELRTLGARVGESASGAPPHVVTLSIGAALYPRHGRTGSALLRVADEAMYRAKSEGRDRVVLAPGTTPTPAHGTAAPSSPR